MPAAVDGHAAHRAVLERRRLGGQNVLQLATPGVGDEVSAVHQVDAGSGDHVVGRLHQQDMRCGVHHVPGHSDRVPGLPHHRDRPRTPVAGHDRGVHLDSSLQCERGAPAGVEQRVVLEGADGRADGVHRGAALAQYGGAAAVGLGQAGRERRGLLVGELGDPASGTAVHNKSETGVGRGDQMRARHGHDRESS